MKYRLLEWLACPACGGIDLQLETVRARSVPFFHGHFEDGEATLPGIDAERREEQEVVEGALHCKGCGLVYPIRDGVPRMMPPGAEQGPDSAHRLTTFDTAYPEWQENFLDLSAPLRPADWLGRLVLDAGCGFGRHSFFAARYGAEVVAMDSSVDAVMSTVRNTETLQRVHVIQGDVFRPPFREGTFDIVFSYGVLHHLDRPRDAFESMGRLVAAGGRLSLWVYGARQGVTLQVNNALRGVTTGLDPEQLHRFSTTVARGLRLFSHTPYKLLGRVPIADRIVSHLPVHDHHKWPFEIVVADIYDRLKIPVRHWFTGRELEVWLTEGGYADVHVARRVGNNETFRASGTRR